jgi:hypothetical protein
MADWDYYQANINDKIASIYLNLDARSDIDMQRHSELCWLFIKLKLARDDGLSHEDEFEALCDYEDNLDEHLEAEKIELVGRVTTDGMRQFYFYSVPGFNFEQSIEVFLSKYQSYQYQYDHKSDPDWGQYSSVLYPKEHGINQINRRREKA